MEVKKPPFDKLQISHLIAEKKILLFGHFSAEYIICTVNNWITVQIMYSAEKWPNNSFFFFGN